MMNASQLLTCIKMDLGIYGLKLPFEDPDKQIMDVIKLRTLRTFSTFLPHIVNATFDLQKDLEIIKSGYSESVYILPDLYNRDILYVRNIYPANRLISTGLMSPVFDGCMDTYYSLMQTQANANLASVAAPPITFEFEAPNRLHLYNLSYGIVDVQMAIMHADNLSSITPTSWESFYELALLDVKKFLYGAMKHYTELQTAFGSFNLRLDDWASADDQRKDLIEKMKDVYHLEVEQIFCI